MRNSKNGLFNYLSLKNRSWVVHLWGILESLKKIGKTK
ncbi:hypothetical protein ADIS_4538 [Lunatimonas lonarensis]|uniref:Uncharacterized protein n=1 Tax=Lunatimonas lonarensis TaxID=1232681 RepID=R7ZLX7_9BACT|nr:hypothetical protein ADIS_4538 [Lunatimonas lonarensis]